MTGTYQIEYNNGKQSFKSKALRIISLALLYAVISALLSLFPWFRNSTETHLWNFGYGLLSGLVSGLLFAFLFTFATKGFRQYELQVSDDSLTANYGFFQRTITRRELRTVKEVPGSVLRSAALIMSKYGSVGTRMWGRIWIPRECKEYEQLRELAFSWKNSEPL